MRPTGSRRAAASPVASRQSRSGDGTASLRLAAPKDSQPGAAYAIWRSVGQHLRVRPHAGCGRLALWPGMRPVTVVSDDVSRLQPEVPGARGTGARVPASVRFGVLGPLKVVDGTGCIRPVPAGKQRIFLAALLLADGHTVSSAALSQALWDASPPANASAVMRTYVMRLRRALGPVAGRIVGGPSGLAVALRAPEEFDLAEVQRLWSQARSASEAGESERVAALLVRALSLWRGDPLTDVPSDALARRELGRLTELRLQLTEARVDADMRLGRHSGLVTELRQLACEHPLREHIQAQLMLACYRCGQQAAALEVYRDARKTLADELGVEPGDELQRLHQKVLDADPELTGFVPGSVSLCQPDGERRLQTRLREVTPRQLPALVRCFKGRAAELARLTKFAAGVRSEGAAAVSVISGMPGVGKTALAVRWAHRVAAEFPDGQLYVDLREYSNGEAVSAADALARFLHAFGIAVADIPLEEDARAATYRSLASGRRLLVVVDNAREPSHVRPLVPGSPSSMVVVTSRDSMSGLVAVDGACRLDLDLLPVDEAVSLLQDLIGDRAVADPRATRILAVHCGRLPLALRAAAERATARPGIPLADLVADLVCQERQLAQGLRGASLRAGAR